MAADEVVEAELEHLLDLGGLRAPRLARLDEPDEREDPVAGHEGAHGRQGAHELDPGRIEPDLLLGLAQRGRAQVLAGMILAPAGERDLTGVPAEVGAPLGEDGGERIPVERHEHGSVLVPGRVHGGGLLGCQKVLAHAPIIRTWPARF